MISKNDILEHYFGDVMRNLITTNRSYLFVVPCIIMLWVVTYFAIRNHIKGYKHRTIDKIYVWIYLGIGLVITVVLVLMLIVYPNIRWKE